VKPETVRRPRPAASALRVPAASGSRRGRIAKLILAVIAGSFVLGYLAVTLLFFPGFGRDAIVTVPDLRGRPYAEARGMTDHLGLVIARGTALPNPRIPAGAVLAQEPMPGQEVTRGGAVHVILSAGPVKRRVPSIDGMDVDDATALLRKFGFTVRIVRVVNPAYEGRVLAIRPAAGAEVPLPAFADLTVSAGPPKILAPSILGLPLDAAAAKLDESGLELGRVQYDPASAAPLGSVASQRPEAGDSIRQGGSVGVTVSGSAPIQAVPVPADSSQPPVPVAAAPTAPPPAK
jgi:serine/threonine-protein kinase